MKRTRRVVSLTIEHREISISHSLRDSRSKSNTVHPEALPTPSVCATCGASWIAVELQGIGGEQPGADGSSPQQIFTQQILAELLQRGLHPVIYVGGKLWMCSQSLQQLRDSL
jgi:hypothetical protein